MPQTAFNDPVLAQSDETSDHFAVDETKKPIDRLIPGSEHHDFVLNYLLRRIKASSDQMHRFYDRWSLAERKAQAYMSEKGYEKLLKDWNTTDRAPGPAQVVIPYAFATRATIVTYMGRTFCSKTPILELQPTGNTTAMKAQVLSNIMDQQNSYQKLIARLYQWFMDGETYGVAIMRNMWTKEYGRRTIWRPPSALEQAYTQAPQVRDFKDGVIFEGNEVVNIDPFMFFPDPNVPMWEVARRGEFVAWREFIGRHVLLTAERLGKVKYVKELKPEDCRLDVKSFDYSSRAMKSGGDGTAGANGGGDVRNFYQVDQGTFEIVPADLGLGPSYWPEKWLFTIIGGKQIIQAQPLDLDHGMHPVTVSEPYTNGYSFGSSGIVDYLGDVQDTISWMLNSHIRNVRATMNNMFVVDPSRVEIADLKRPEPGKIIRLKRNAIGTDVREAVHQLTVQDVTAQHIANLPIFIRVGDSIAAVNDTLRGQNATGGRKTAAEIRSTGESSLSRLSTQAQKYSSQGLCDMGIMQSMNIQQFTTVAQQLVLNGNSMTVTPADLQGQFIFPIHDGTLPLDKGGMLDTFVNLLKLIISNPNIVGQYDIQKMIDHAAQLGGMLNLSSFRNANPMVTPQGAPPPSIQPTQRVMQQAQQGNLVPVGPV